MAARKPVTRPAIIEVEWVDSMGTGGWRPVKDRIADFDKVEDLDHVTTGYLAKRTRDYVLVFQSIGRTENCDNAIQIPMCAVRKVTTIRRGIK